MKLHFALVVISLIMFVKFQKSQAKKNLDDDLDDFIAQIINNPSKDDNILVGDNNVNRVQINGKEYIHYSKNNKPPDYVDEKIHTNTDDNINSGYNIRDRVQINGRTIFNDPKTNCGKNHSYENIKPLNNDDNIISGNNIKNCVQINGKTIVENSSPKELNAWEKFKKLFY